MKLLISPPSCHSFPISQKDKVFLIGSCFTEHIGKKLANSGFHILQNPHGILFDPLSIERAFQDYIGCHKYSESDLFLHQEIYRSWNFHSEFSDISVSETLEKMNNSIETANTFLISASVVIVTLGSSFVYYNLKNELYVSNCHKASASDFRKEMVSIENSTNALNSIIDIISKFNPTAKIIFNISPVRHIRDGVVENNRSKARLLEALHSIIDNAKTFYFPSYELVIDVLRDYRFYDIDMVHPNFLATETVFEFFSEKYFDAETFKIAEEMRNINISRSHRSQNPNTEAHKSFLKNLESKVEKMEKEYPYLNLGY
jgi:hypothetical protein